MRAGPERRTVSNNTFTVNTVRLTVLTVNGTITYAGDVDHDTFIDPRNKNRKMPDGGVLC